jgi:predicted lactoylglutathione lyase
MRFMLLICNDDSFRPPLLAHSVKQHSASAARTRAEVDAFQAAALKAGGTDNGPPGLRRPHYYAAFVLDPDRNNIEAVYRGD